MDILVDCCQENPANVATACGQFRMLWNAFHTLWRTIIHHWVYTWYDMIYDMIWYDTIWYDMIWYDMHSLHFVSKFVCVETCAVSTTQEEFDAMTSDFRKGMAAKHRCKPEGYYWWWKKTSCTSWYVVYQCLSHYLQGFIHPRWLARFLPSTVVHTDRKGQKMPKATLMTHPPWN